MESVYTPNIRVFDKNMVWLLQTNAYTSLEVKLDYYNPHEIKIRMNPSVVDPNNFSEEGFLTYRTPDMPRTLVFLIESKNITISPAGKESDELEICGRGMKAIFDSRRHMSHYGVGDGYDTLTNVSPEHAIRTYIEHEVISPSDSSRNIPGISFDTFAELPENNGNMIAEIKKRAESLLDTVVTLGKTYKLGVDILWYGGKDFRIAFSRGRNLTTVGTTGCVTLSLGLKNLNGGSRLDDYTSNKNVVYVAGAGVGTSRPLHIAGDVGGNAGWKRKEMFSDAADCATQNQLIARGRELLAENTVIPTIGFEYTPRSQSYVYGRDFGLGDLVNVVVSGSSQATEIISVIYTHDADGIGMKMEGNRAPPDWIKILAKSVKATAVGGRK